MTTHPRQRHLPTFPLLVCSALLIHLLGLAACSKTPDLQSELIGEWSNVSMEVTVHSYQNSDSTFVFTVSASDWEQQLQMKPIRTKFLADGSYVSEYRGLDDSLLQVSTGTWSVRDDSLILASDDTSYSFHVSIEDSLGRFSGLTDWDEDGQVDDEYVGIQQRLNQELR